MVSETSEDEQYDPGAFVRKDREVPTISRNDTGLRETAPEAGAIWIASKWRRDSPDSPNSDIAPASHSKDTPGPSTTVDWSQAPASPAPANGGSDAETPSGKRSPAPLFPTSPSFVPNSAEAPTAGTRARNPGDVFLAGGTFSPAPNTFSGFIASPSASASFPAAAAQTAAPPPPLAPPPPPPAPLPPPFSAPQVPAAYWPSVSSFVAPASVSPQPESDSEPPTPVTVSDSTSGAGRAPYKRYTEAEDKAIVALAVPRLNRALLEKGDLRPASAVNLKFMFEELLRNDTQAAALLSGRNVYSMILRLQRIAGGDLFLNSVLKCHGARAAEGMRKAAAARKREEAARRQALALAEAPAPDPQQKPGPQQRAPASARKSGAPRSANLPRASQNLPRVGDLLPPMATRGLPPSSNDEPTFLSGARGAPAAGSEFERAHAARQAAMWQQERLAAAAHAGGHGQSAGGRYAPYPAWTTPYARAGDPFPSMPVYFGRPPRPPVSGAVPTAPRAEPYPIRCVFCPAVFPTALEAGRHLRAAHDGQSWCDFCGASLACNDEALAHMRAVHPLEFHARVMAGLGAVGAGQQQAAAAAAAADDEDDENAPGGAPDEGDSEDDDEGELQQQKQQPPPQHRQPGAAPAHHVLHRPVPLHPPPPPPPPRPPSPPPPAVPVVSAFEVEMVARAALSDVDLLEPNSPAAGVLSAALAPFAGWGYRPGRTLFDTAARAIRETPLPHWTPEALAAAVAAPPFAAALLGRVTSLLAEVVADFNRQVARREREAARQEALRAHVQAALFRGPQEAERGAPSTEAPPSAGVGPGAAADSRLHL
eukprot:tig00001021_g6305.t1